MGGAPSVRAGLDAAVPLLATRALSKSYEPVQVLQDVDFAVSAGSIHALLGENGAGKSTLIKVLSGAASLSSGEVLLAGERFAAHSVRDAQAAGIVALPQELTLVPGLDAAQNIFLGLRTGTRWGVVRRRELRAEAAKILAALGQDLPLAVPVGELSAVQQTMVALARALARRARVLILDEPTASLTDTETAGLFAVLRQLRDAGTAIIYVSHRLDEVFALADSATVLRGGMVRWSGRLADTTPDAVVHAMIGSAPEQVFPPRTAAVGETVLEARGLSGFTARDVSLRVRAGQVLGLAGLAGAGRSEVLRMLAGAQSCHSGSVVFNGRDVSRLGLRARLAAGIAFVPEERRSQGLILDASIAENVALTNLAGLSRAGVVRQQLVERAAQDARERFRIRAHSLRQPVREMSGGNQQKVVLAKYLARKPQVLLLDEPTRGIDIGTKAEIYQLVRELARAGVAVVVVSSENQELLGLADEIAVLHEGRLQQLVPAAGTSEEDILRLCYGRSAA